VAAALVAIVGPTASGKSALGLELALEVGGEIVSCDSLQVYRGLDIGSAKASLEERRRVRHHLIDVVSPGEVFSAADYARLARKAVAEIAERGHLPLVVGGSGLYLRALLHGLFEGPSRNERLRRRLDRLADSGGEGRLHRMLSRVDPVAARRIHPRDRVRLVRALEVYFHAGEPLSSMHRQQPDALEGFRVRVVGLAPPRDVLREAIRRRTTDMFRAGLVGEVGALLASGLLPTLRPLQAIGYRQALSVVLGQSDEQAAEAATAVATAQFAKRQMTWFRHQADVEWHEDPAAAKAAILAWLAGGAGRAL
jgi:tRNA dimethylallyltransferase